MRVVGPFCVTQRMFDEILAVQNKKKNDCLRPTELLQLLISEAPRICGSPDQHEASVLEESRPPQPVIKAVRDCEAKAWAKSRLAKSSRRSSRGNPSSSSASPSRSPFGRHSHSAEQRELEEALLGRIIREAPPPPPEEEEPQVSLEELVARELKEQSAFLSEITQRRDHGRQQLDAARKVERKHHETMRYLGARHRELLKKIAQKKITLPPLCSCGIACLEPHADQCANNCVFYKNHHAYEQALATLLASYDV